MAHKLRYKVSPHVNKDGSASVTKKDHRVICKRRGHVCTDEVFSSEAKARKHIAEHWDYVNVWKHALANSKGASVKLVSSPSFPATSDSLVDSIRGLARSSRPDSSSGEMAA